MKMRLRIATVWFSSLILVALSCVAVAQVVDPGAAPAAAAGASGALAGRGGRGGAGRGPAVVSPEVHPDRTVTLRIQARNATSVTVSGEIMGTNPPAALTKDDNGVWSVTLGPLEPEIYSYGFNVDGMTVNDQHTSYIKPSSSTTSQVEVPGDGPRFYHPRPVPHGDLRIVMYEARTLDGRTRRMRVYTPPDYDSGNKKYPVLYLFHGAGDWDVAWTDVGRANLILDNLIADGKAKPMIVVMPSIVQQAALGAGAMESAAGRGAPGAAGGSGAGGRGAGGRGAGGGSGRGGRGAAAGGDDAFTRELLGDIMPLIQKKYRILTGPDNTAIMGLSMGGAQALRTGAGHLDMFHYIFAFSPAVGIGGGGRGGAPAATGAGAGGGAAPAPNLTAAYPGLMNDVAAANKKLKQFGIFCGAQDTVVRDGPKLVANALIAKGVNVKFTETPGGHWFIVWRQNLRDTAPLLFR